MYVVALWSLSGILKYSLCQKRKIRSPFKCILKVGVTELIVIAPRITDILQMTDQLHLQSNLTFCIVCVFTRMTSGAF
jgi:hypothetical protein